MGQNNIAVSRLARNIKSSFLHRQSAQLRMAQQQVVEDKLKDIPPSSIIITRQQPKILIIPRRLSVPRNDLPRILDHPARKNSPVRYTAWNLINPCNLGRVFLFTKTFRVH